jgi:Cu(I)/Ag(I) efflux system membrane fusion protein/cobalt-zinc-cadmium efflux system membrane fusion protein
MALSIALFVGFMAISGCGSKEESKTGKTEQVNPGQAKVYDGVIDLKAIDANKDGKVFQCPMDYNVLSDAAGTCPKCNMDLEETSVDVAREKLTANNFQVK